MIITDEKLKDILVRPGHVALADFEQVRKEAATSKKSIADMLVEKDLIKDEQLGQLLAEEFHVPFLWLRDQNVDEKALRLIPELVARARGIVALTQSKDGIRVGMRNPGDIETIHFIEKKTGQKLIVHYITQKDFHDILARYKADLHVEFEKVLGRLQDQALSREERDNAIVTMVDTLLQYGYENKASDVHIEPHRSMVVVRFRIDGVMHDVLEFPKDILDLLLTRIKILSKLRTDEHRAAQDGKLNVAVDGEQIDVRVSVVPVTEGENIVMRLLSANARQYSLTDIGLADSDLQKIHRAIDNPHGMILVTGPTGSGKTTTVYAMLKILNTRDVHISTIEDPVEYDIEGISQIQVNTRTNLTFAKGLRAIVRQDPDIIMVGEIRDEETADIAVNSAMTGHLVLSTLHANDAATTLPRLLDMHVEPFLVASTVNIVVAQRLVRRICDKCKVSHELTAEEKDLITHHPTLKAMLMPSAKKKTSESVRFYKGAGCSVCANTGYVGRIGIFELLESSDEIRRLITARASSDDIIKVARGAGMTTMMEDGVRKVLAGTTTLEEVVRATKE